MTKTRFQALVIVLLAGILALILSRLYAAVPSVSPSPQVGRYQLFQGYYQVEGEDKQGQGVFLLDTATGKVKTWSIVILSAPPGLMKTQWMDSEYDSGKPLPD